MPRATKFLKEDIIEAASAVVKKEGLSAINARRVAKELGCSVQPIFYQFENMEDLKQATILHIRKIYQSYMIAGSKEEKVSRIRYGHLKKQKKMRSYLLQSKFGNQEECIYRCRTKK